ncbi:MAG: hypothetical protein K2Q34_04195 [Alphaproteobacteria bacterium]|nr:hypothetical protein [Alphaproteobacteria bacterium]
MMKKLICTILLGTALIGGNALAATTGNIGIAPFPSAAESKAMMETYEGVRANPHLFPKESPELAAIPYFYTNCSIARDKASTLPDDKKEEARLACSRQETYDPYVVYIFDKGGNLLQKVGMREDVEYGFNVAPGTPKTPLRLDAHAVEGIPSLGVPKGSWNIPASLNTMLGKTPTDIVSPEENTFPKEGDLASVPYFKSACIAAKEGTGLKADIKELSIRRCQAYVNGSQFTAYIFGRKSGGTSRPLLQKIGMNEGMTYVLRGYENSVQLIEKLNSAPYAVKEVIQFLKTVR